MELVLTKINQPEEMKMPEEDDFPIKLDETIKQIIEREGFTNFKVNKQCVSTNGGNYLGSLYEIDVKGRTKDGNKELNIFIKHIISIESLKVLSISDVYNTELFAYKELSKIFLEFQEKANVPMVERYKMVKAYEESNAEAIIMENTVKQGFTTYYRMDAMPLSFVEKSIEQLAKFHALSFVLKARRPTYFDKNIRSLKHPFIFGDSWELMVKSSREAAIKHVDDKYKAKIEKVYEDLVLKFDNYCNDESVKVCLCHGDFRANNIMVKIEEGEIQEVLPVDYQLMHYGCPVFDFLYLIISGTERSFRKVHTSKMKDLYFKTLSNFLKYFNLDVNMVYPRREFEKVYKEKLDYGLMVALMFLPFFLASETDVPDMSKELSDMAFQVDYRFKDRLRGIIEDYVEWGYI